MQTHNRSGDTIITAQRGRADASRCGLKLVEAKCMGSNNI